MRIIPPKKDPKIRQVYFMQNVFGLVKIGYSKDIKVRLNSIRSVSLLTPSSIKYLWYYDSDDWLGLERSLHHHFAPYRRKGEWFDPAILETIKDVEISKKITRKLPNVRLI